MLNNVFHFVRQYFGKSYVSDIEIITNYKINRFVIESTSRCNLKCVMCPRNSYSQHDGDFNFGLFLKISNYFKEIEFIDLSGWGEPLLNDKICDMVKIAKSYKCKVGFTTNGMLLNPEIIRKLIENGIDYIDISLDGGTAHTYEKIRGGAVFEHLINNIKSLSEIKRELVTDKPSLTLTFCMMQQNIHELPDVIKIAKKYNISTVVAKNLDVISNKDDLDEIIHSFFDNKATKVSDNTIKMSIHESKNLADKLGINLITSALKPNEMNNCWANPLNTIFISHTGNVSFCCNLGHPVPRVISFDKILPNTQKTYGNLKNQSMSEILSSNDYKIARNLFEKHEIPDECQGCLLIKGI